VRRSQPVHVTTFDECFFIFADYVRSRPRECVELFTTIVVLG
jgi:hypothetical protein